MVQPTPATYNTGIISNTKLRATSDGTSSISRLHKRALRGRSKCPDADEGAVRVQYKEKRHLKQDAGWPHRATRCTRRARREPRGRRSRGACRLKPLRCVVLARPASGTAADVRRGAFRHSAMLSRQEKSTAYCFDTVQYSTVRIERPFPRDNAKTMAVLCAPVQYRTPNVEHVSFLATQKCLTFQV